MRFFRESWKFIAGSLLLYGVLKIAFGGALVSTYIQQITLFSFIVIITSLGLNVIYGYTGQFSLGHAAFYGIGAYASAWISRSAGIVAGSTTGSFSPGSR